MFKKFTLLCCLIFSCLTFAEETPQNKQDSKTKELFTKGQQIIAGGPDVYIPKGQIHRLSNPGSGPLEIIEVQTGTYLGEDDIDRIEDNYKRV